MPAAVSLGVFVWLLTLHPHAAGRVFAAYGGVDSVKPTITDFVGVGVCLVGMAIIIFGPKHA